MDSKSTFSFKALCSGHHQKMILEIMRIHYTARGIRGVVCFFKNLLPIQCELSAATRDITGTNSEIWAGPYGGSLGFSTEPRILLQ